MWGLVLTTILTSAADCLNPIAITQQFVLQGMVKKPRHIWYFILPTGLTNLLGGFLAYFGLIGFAGDFFKTLIEKYGRLVFICELALGAVFLAVACLITAKAISKSRERKLKAANCENGVTDEIKAARKIKSVAPIGLIGLGAAATISELTTALPYFAFLTALSNYSLTLAQAALILVVYNTIYMLPLMVLYFVYVAEKNKFDRIYLAIKNRISKWAGIIAPIIAGAIGIFLAVHSLTLLL